MTLATIPAFSCGVHDSMWVLVGAGAVILGALVGRVIGSVTAKVWIRDVAADDEQHECVKGTEA